MQPTHSFAGGNGTETSEVSHIDLNLQNLESKLSDRSGVVRISHMSVSQGICTRNNTNQQEENENFSPLFNDQVQQNNNN